MAVGVRVPMVRPQRVMTSVATADLRAEPRADSELVDQSHYGERLAILGAQGEWRWVQGEDHYFGWIARAAIREVVERSEERLVAVVRAAVRDEPDALSPSTGLLPVGSSLRPSRREGGWIEIPLGWVALGDTVDPDDLPRRAPTADDLIATAEAFLQAPYRWGGTTGGGIDCSGFVQQVYRLNGVGLDRDADQQAMEGRAVPLRGIRSGSELRMRSAARPGDLLFFGAERVTHVALATGEREFIHAPGTGGFVERSRLSAERVPRAIRRYLMDVSLA